MKKITSLFLIISTSILANDIAYPVTSPTDDLANVFVPVIVLSEKLAFPGAEGHGKYTVGGEGGYVYHVTSLADTNTNGTFRYGIETLTGDRTIVFDISGTIEMTTYIKIRDGHGDVTILGQTAPEGGIHLAKAPFWIHDSEVIMRYMTHRLGKDWTNNNADNYQNPSSPDYEPDASFLIRAFTSPISNFMFSNMSTFWGHDGSFNAGGISDANPVSNISIQSCLIAETIDKKYGTLMNAVNSTYYRTLIAQGLERCPSYLRPIVRTEFINSISYNSRENHSINYSSHADFIGNVYKYGNNTKTSNTWQVEGGNGGVLLDTELYFSDNIGKGTSSTSTSTSITGNSSIVKSSPTASSGISSILPAIDVENSILPEVGSSIWRDAADTRVVNDYINGTGSLVSDEDEVGGFPNIPSVTRPSNFYSSLNDIPESFVQEHGITSNSQVITNWNFGTYKVVNNAGYNAFQMYGFWLPNDFTDLESTTSATIGSSKISNTMLINN